MQSSWVCRLVGDSTEYLTEQGKTVCHGVVVVRSLTWPGSYTFYTNGKQTTLYVGSGLKMTDKVKPFPVCPPILITDDEEYGEFVLPEIKVLSPEELVAEIEKHFEECWSKQEADEDGKLGDDDIKKVAGDIKGKMDGKEEGVEINEEAFDSAYGAIEKSEEGKIGKDAAKAFICHIYEKL